MVLQLVEFVVGVSVLLLLEVDGHGFIPQACAGLHAEDGSSEGTPLCHTP